MQVPFFDWSGLYAERADEFNKVITNVLSKGGFILQKDVEEFEESLADYVGAKYAVGLSDGTNAILLGLRASDVKRGDEILITSHSFIAAAQSINHVGCIPVPVELSFDDWLMDADLLERSLTERTKAIMPVHVNGRVCQMDKILEFAEKVQDLVYQ